MGNIEVKGVGKMAQAPDCIELALELKLRDIDYSAVMKKADKELTLLVDALESVGLNSETLKTSNFAVSTIYDNKNVAGEYKQIFAGYECSHSLSVRFDFDMARLAKTINALAKSGASANYNIAFVIKDKANLTATLMDKAVKDAIVKANTLAQSAGIKLGKITHIAYGGNEVNVYSPTRVSPRVRQMSACANDDSNIEINPQDIISSETVDITFEIE